MGSKKSEPKKSNCEKQPFGGKLASFWRKHILRKKDGDDRSTTSSSTASLSSEEKNQLTAEAATSGLRLDQKTREQVTKALASEMQRRHMERERRRKELIASTRAQLPWGKKAPAKAKYVQPKPSTPGASVFPIKMVPKTDAKSPSVSGRESSVGADIEEEWRPVAAVAPAAPASSAVGHGNAVPSSTQSLSLEEQRKKWLQRNAQPTAKKPLTSQSMMLAGPPTVESSSQQVPPDVARVFGSQPTELQLDDTTVQEIHSHTFEKIIAHIAREAQKETKAVKAKDPQDMTPDELVELLKADPDAWDQFTRQNTVISFGVTSPTDEDKDRGKKAAKARHANVIKFESEIDVTSVPVGKDFNPREKKQVTTSSLKK